MQFLDKNSKGKYWSAFTVFSFKCWLCGKCWLMITAARVADVSCFLSFSLHRLASHLFFLNLCPQITNRWLITY